MATATRRRHLEQHELQDKPPAKRTPRKKVAKKTTATRKKVAKKTTATRKKAAKKRGRKS